VFPRLHWPDPIEAKPITSYLLLLTSYSCHSDAKKLPVRLFPSGSRRTGRGAYVHRLAKSHRSHPLTQRLTYANTLTKEQISDIDPTLNAFRPVPAVSMKRGRAETILREVQAVLRRWPEYADQAGVNPEHRDRIQKTLRLDISR